MTMNDIPKLVDVAKPVPRGQCVAIDPYMREIKAKKQQSNILFQEIRKRKAN